MLGNTEQTLYCDFTLRPSSPRVCLKRKRKVTQAKLHFQWE